MQIVAAHSRAVGERESDRSTCDFSTTIDQPYNNSFEPTDRRVRDLRAADADATRRISRSADRRRHDHAAAAAVADSAISPSYPLLLSLSLFPCLSFLRFTLVVSPPRRSLPNEITESESVNISLKRRLASHSLGLEHTVVFINSLIRSLISF